MFRHHAVYILFGLLSLLPQTSFADSVGQAQVTKFFTPETIQMLEQRINTGTPGIQDGDIISYIIESVPIDDGGSQGVNGYITDYIPPGLQVIGASFVDMVPNPTLPGGVGYVDIPLRNAAPMLEGIGNRGANFTGLAPFDDGGLPEGSQDTGVFYSTDPRTSYLAVPIGDVVAFTGAGFSNTFPIHNAWDFAQFVAFGGGGGSLGIVLGAGNPGSGVQPIINMGAFFAGLASPVAGPQTYYTNDYNHGALVLGQASLNAAPAYLNTDFMNVGPWQRIAYSGSSMGGSGPVTINGTGGAGLAVSTAVPTSAGRQLNANYGLPYVAGVIPATPGNTNTVRWAFGQRVVGAMERVKITFKVRDFANFAAAGIDFQNHSSVFGGDTSAPAAGKDLTYKYLGPTQSISDARIMVIKRPIAYSKVAGPAYVWQPMTGTTVVVNDFIKYNITYLNATATTLQGFEMHDILGPELTYIPGSATTGVPYLTVPTVSAVGVDWVPVFGSPEATLNPGEGGFVELVVQVTNGGGALVATNTANGLAAVPAVSAFSYSPLNISAARPGNLSQSKTVSTSTAAPGGVVRYSVVVNSIGGGLATPVAGGLVGVNTVPAGAALVIGDLLDSNIAYTSTVSVKLRNRTTGNIYTYLAGDAFTVPAAPALAPATAVYWTINGYPTGYPAPPVAGSIDFLANVDVLIDFDATVSALAAPGTYYNQLESYVNDPIAGADLAFTTPQLTPVTVFGAGAFPDLTLTKAATDLNGGFVRPGDTLQYDFVLANGAFSVGAADNVIVTDALPNGVSFVVGSALAVDPAAVISYSNTGGSDYLYMPVGVAGAQDPNVTNIKVDYSALVGGFGVGVTQAFSFQVALPAYLLDADTVINQAVVNAAYLLSPFVVSSDDPATLAAVDPTVSTIVAKPDFGTSTKTVVGNTGGGTNVAVADVLTYSITVNNTGYTTFNVKVEDTIDLNALTFTSMGVLPANWGVTGPDANGKMIWSALSMDAGTSATLTFNATVNALANGSTVDNTALISSDESNGVLNIPAPTLTIPAPKAAGFVFNDLNANGIKDVGENTVANVTVALRATGTIVDTVTTVTNANGAYELIAPNAGAWDVQVTDASAILAGFNATSPNPLAVTLVDGVTLTNQNMGFVLADLPAQVSGRMFNDLNANGLQDGLETGYPLVTIELQTPTGVIIDSFVTDAQGDYIFPSIAAGDYRLVITDTANVLDNLYLTTGLVSPVPLNGLLANSTSQVHFGYKLGSSISGLVFDDLNNDGINGVGEIGVPGVTVELKQAGITVVSTTTDNSGVYQFSAVAPSAATNYDLVVTKPVGFALTTVVTSSTATHDTIALAPSLAGTNYPNNDLGYFAVPVFTVSKSVDTPITSTQSGVKYTITIQNTGGSAANFSIRDLLPTSTPPAGGYTPSPTDFLYLSTSSVKLNGVNFTIPTVPMIYSTQPVWSGFSMPGSSILEITFLAFTGLLEGVHWNGVQLTYNNNPLLNPDSLVDYPNMAPVTVSSAGTIGKVVASINAVPWTGVGDPVVEVGDTIRYTVTVKNSSAALAQTVQQFTETMPANFTYVLGSTVIISPFNQPAAPAADPIIATPNLTWVMPVGAEPLTAATAISEITLSFDVLVGAAAVDGTHTDVATADVVVNAQAPVLLSTGDTAPVVVSRPSLSMSKTTSTSLISRDNLGNYDIAAYTIVVRNTGAVAATGVVITDTLPSDFFIEPGSGAVLVDGSATASSFSGTAPLTITSNPAGGFTIPAHNGISDGLLVITYNLIIPNTNVAGTYVNSASLTSTNGGTLTGSSANIELTDIQLSKTTSTPTVFQGGIASYVISVVNHGAVVVNNISVSDLLPVGFTYRAGTTFIDGVATVDSGLGTVNVPQWTAFNLAGNTTVTIAFDADVSASKAPGIYYNTIQASNADGLSFPNPGPTAPVTISAPQPVLTLQKTAAVFSDPIRGTVNPLAIPGAIVGYTLQVMNSGTGAVDTDALALVDIIDANTALVVTDIAGGLGPVGFADNPAAAGISSALTYTFTSFASTTDDVSFSTDGINFNYTPIVDANGVDVNITHIKISPKGSMPVGTGAGNPVFELKYNIRVQ